MMIQKFNCARCGKEGEAHLSNDPTIIQALNSIKNAHEEMSPDCSFNTVNIIIFVPKFVDNTTDK
jgi:hypothetical protein